MKSELSHTQLSDSEFRKQFENCTLNPTLFSHEAHLRLAWIHIDKYGIERAKENIQNQLQHFVEHVGAKDKYHKTLTIVAVQAVNHFMRNSNSDTFRDFITEYPQLKVSFKELINSHYSFDVFKSAKAKTEYLKPDISPFE